MPGPANSTPQESSPDSKAAARNAARAAWNAGPPFPIISDLLLLSRAIAASTKSRVTPSVATPSTGVMSPTSGDFSATETERLDTGTLTIAANARGHARPDGACKWRFGSKGALVIYHDGTWRPDWPRLRRARPDPPFRPKSSGFQQPPFLRTNARTNGNGLSTMRGGL
jgi:hypothetical protein